jgi:hypothetical protein
LPIGAENRHLTLINIKGDVAKEGFLPVKGCCLD